MIAEGTKGVVDFLFNGVKRKDEAGVLFDQQSAPNRHLLQAVLFEVGAFSQKDPDVVPKRSGDIDGATRVAECVESVKLWFSLPLLASF